MTQQWPKMGVPLTKPQNRGAVAVVQACPSNQLNKLKTATTSGVMPAPRAPSHAHAATIVLKCCELCGRMAACCAAASDYYSRPAVICQRNSSQEQMPHSHYRRGMVGTRAWGWLHTESVLLVTPATHHSGSGTSSPVRLPPAANNDCCHSSHQWSKFLRSHGAGAAVGPQRP